MKKLIKIIWEWIHAKAERDFLNSPIGKNLENCHQIVKEMNEEIIERKVAPERKCSETVLTKEFLMVICKGIYLKEFKPSVVYIANTHISEEELQKTIEWISNNKLYPALLDAKEIDEKWEGKFIYNFDNGDRCIEYDPEFGFCIKLTIDELQNKFQFKFVNIFTDREWKMKMMFADIQKTINKMEEIIKEINKTKKIFAKWLMQKK